MHTKSKAELRAEVAALTAAFLANGGTIAKYRPNGERIA